MATRLGRLRARLVDAFGRPDPLHADAVFALDRASVVLLPFTDERRQHVAKLCRAGIVNGYRIGQGVAGLRRALRRGVELGDAEPMVAHELAGMLEDLADIIKPTAFD